MLVETIKEMVDTRYDDLNLSLQTIADTLGMTSAYVSRVFRKAESIAIHKKQYGTTPKEYRLKRSIENSGKKRLL